MSKTRVLAYVAAALMLSPMASAFGASPYGSARTVSHMGGCDSCGCDVPCAAPCGDCCDPCCVPLIPALLHRIDSALQRVFCCRCYDPCACGSNCWDCAGCSGGYSGGGYGGGCSSCGGGAGPDVISGHLTPVPRAARVKQTMPRGAVTRGVSTARKIAAPTPAARTAPAKKAAAPVRVKTAAAEEVAPIASDFEEEVGSQVQRTSYSSSKSRQPKNPLR